MRKFTIMIKKSTLFFWIIVIPHLVYAQYFSIEDIEFGRLSNLKPAEIMNLQWVGKSDNLIFSRNDTLFIHSIANREENSLLTLRQLNKLLQKNDLTTVHQIPEIQSHSFNIMSFYSNQYLVWLDLNKKEITEISIPEKAENIIPESKNLRIAYTIGQNVFIREKNDETAQITYDTLEGILNGAVVYRHEFGMEVGMSWSPEGNYLAYYRKDESKVGRYPLVNIQKPIARVEPIYYPMAGMTSEETEIWVYALNKKCSIKLKIPGKPDDYHTNLSWSPDEKYMYLQHLNRNQDTLILRYYSSESGELQQELFIETHPKYVEPLNSIIFSKKDPGNFLYQSERDGFNHVYFFKSSTGELLQLTQGSWEVTRLLGFDNNENYIYFIATKESPLERHLYRYELTEKSIKRLTNDAGTHKVAMNERKTLFIDEFSSSKVPRTIRVVENNGSIISELLIAPNPLSDYILGDVIVGTITAADKKTPLYYRLTKPINFDSTKRYPVIVYVYGGPHIQLITNSWLTRTDYLHQYYAQQGIASFEIDCRGSDFRGRDFENVIHRQLGLPQIDDQFQGIKFLKTISWIDTSRIGIEGWSFGGFMTLSMMLHFPNVFKVGIAGGPVTDWSLYEVMYGERYMDRPEQNPDGYKNTNVNLMVERLQGKLLVIHGALDDVVVWQNSLIFLQECINQGKHINYFIYPIEKHNVSGKERKHLTEMTTQYFLDNL